MQWYLNLLDLLYTPFTLQATRPVVNSFTQCRTASQVAPFHKSCTHYKWCNLQSFNYRIRFICEFVSQWRNLQYLNSPYVAILHQKMTESQPYVHRGPHLPLSYSKKFICAYTKLSRSMLTDRNRRQKF